MSLTESKCVACNNVDTDPKHHTFRNGTWVSHHFDCHRPDCATCTSMTTGVEHLRGAELRAHLAKGLTGG